MPREPVEAKAIRYLTAGRLQVLEVTPQVVRAECAGSTGELHRVGWWRGRWGCSCPAGRFSRTCCHLLALRLVVP
ncbi:MAG TPA: hypothetical protein VF995_07340, partial [Actinomycetota bacterium]